MKLNNILNDDKTPYVSVDFNLTGKVLEAFEYIKSIIDNITGNESIADSKDNKSS